MDVSEEDNKRKSKDESRVKPKEQSPVPGRRQGEEKRPLSGNDTTMVEISMTGKYERTLNGETKVVGITGHEKETNSVADVTNNLSKDAKPSETVTKGKDVAGRKEESLTENVQYKSRTVTTAQVVQEKTTSKISFPPPRSPATGRRQLPADPSLRFPQTTKENIVIKSSHSKQEVVERNEKRTPSAKPLSELNVHSNTAQQFVTGVPKSTKTHATPPVPMPRSSGSTSAPNQRLSGTAGAPVAMPRSSGSTVGRHQSQQPDTSGYPDAFNKRKSRESREISDAALHQLGKFLVVRVSPASSPCQFGENLSTYKPPLL